MRLPSVNVFTASRTAASLFVSFVDDVPCGITRANSKRHFAYVFAFSLSKLMPRAIEFSSHAMHRLRCLVCVALSVGSPEPSVFSSFSLRFQPLFRSGLIHSIMVFQSRTFALPSGSHADSIAPMYWAHRLCASVTITSPLSFNLYSGIFGGLVYCRTL